MIEFGLNAWLLVLLLVAATSLTWFVYRQTEPSLQGIYRWLLPALRGTALAFLLTLLFEPLLQRNIRQESLPIQAVLVDESQSMAHHQMTETIPTTKGETHYFGFGGTIRSIDHLSAAMDSAPRTDIANALAEIRNSMRHKNLRSVLLISDGQYNTGRNPVYVAANYGIPIHTLVVGDTLQQQDLMIARTMTNELAYVGQEVPVDVSLLLRGYSDAMVTTSLYARDSLIMSQILAVSEGESTASLSFIPEKEGLFQYILTTTELENEATTANNRAMFTVRVLKRSQRVCIIAAAPHPDLTAIRSILSRDEQRQIDGFVQMQPGRFYEGNLPNSLDDYDAIILVGFPGPEADGNSLNTVVRAAQSGTPLLFMLTRQTDLERLQNSFINVLPAVPTAPNVLFDEAMPQLTPAGLRNPILDFPEALWERFPPLTAITGNWDVTVDSRILAQVNLRGIPLQEPLIVIRNRAGIRAAAVLGSGTWRWLNLAGDPAEIPRIWPQMVENLMQWLTTPEDDRTVRVEPVLASFDGNSPIDFSGQVYDESLNPVPDAVVTVELMAPDGTQYPYTMTNVGGGRFALRIDALPAGAYSYTAQATWMNASMGTDSGVFTVGSINLESRSTGSNKTLLRQIAYRSGGHFFTEESIGALPDRLNSDSLFVSATESRDLEYDLRRIPWILGMVILLLGLEWVLRKRNGLA